MSVQIRVDIFCDRCQMPMRRYRDLVDPWRIEDADTPPIYSEEGFRDYFVEAGNVVGDDADREWAIWCDKCLARHADELRYEDHAYCDDCEADLGEEDTVKPPNRGDIDNDLYTWLCDKCLALQAEDWAS